MVKFTIISVPYVLLWKKNQYSVLPGLFIENCQLSRLMREFFAIICVVFFMF